MLDKALTYIASAWMTALIGGNVILAFVLPDTSIFRIGWVPILPLADPFGTLWWIIDVIIALPAIGLLMLRDRLRRRRASMNPQRAG
jgi:hypothetical protein